jgi:hypothetical protein
MPSNSYQTRRPGGNYFAAFGGAPKNAGAAYGVPDQTYGGRAAGGPTPWDHAFGMIGPQQINSAATGNQYAPMHQSPMGVAPSTMGGYMGQMANQNPGGRFFQGALPVYGASAGGVRPMFMGAPSPQGPSPQMQQSAAQSIARYFDPRTGTMSQEHLGGYNASNIRAMQLSGMGPNYKPPANVGQMQQNYFSRTSQDMAGRQAGVQANAFNSSQARKARMGIGDPLDMAMRGNPQIAAMMGMGQMGLQGQMGQQALGWGQLQQQAQQQHFQNMAALAGHVAGMQGVPPGLQQGYMNQIMQQFGLQGGQGGGMTGTGQQRANYSLTPQQQGQFRNLKTAAEKEKWLNDNGIMDTMTRQFMLGTHVAPSSQPGVGDYAANVIGGAAGFGMLGPWGLPPAPGAHPNTYTPMQRWMFGIPELVRPTKPAKR